MVDLRQSPKPRDYFSRREQWRLLLLVMSLGLVLILMNEARKPENWQWLFGKPQAGQKEAGQWKERIDLGRQSAGPLPEEKQPGKETEAKVLPDDAPSGGVERPGGDESSGEYFPGVNPELLDAVRDKARFRTEEHNAWFHLFAVLKAAEPAQLRRGSIGRIARIQLSEQSKAYRGELVTTRGVIRRAHWIKAPKNDYGIVGYYQLWIQPDDDPAWPIAVYCLGLPEGFPTGMEISERAALTGFYFKRWLYLAEEGLRLAPVILVRGIEREEPKPFFLDRTSLGFWGWMVTLGGAALVAVAIVSYVYRRTRRTKRPLPATIGDVREQGNP